MNHLTTWAFSTLLSLMPFFSCASQSIENTGDLEAAFIEGIPVFQVCDTNLSMNRDILKMRLLSLIKERQSSKISGRNELSEAGLKEDIISESGGAFFGAKPKFIKKRYLKKDYLCAYLPIHN